jgi:hypothetical protein
MANSGNKNSQKLLDYWEPPDNVKEPIGCISTTFTFDSSFFEEQCLTRFVKMESDAFSDGPAYLIEREEKFSALKCATVFVDANHCKGKRSLRWDLLPFKSTNGILHAKISLLHWVNFVRIIIGSANITEDGYRKNQEIFGVVDFYEGSETPYNFLVLTLEYLNSLIEQNQYDKTNAASDRYKEFINLVSKNSRSWNKERSFKKNRDIAIHPVFTTQNSIDLLNQIKELWYNHASRPPKWAYVTSPFFNPPDAENIPAKKIWEILNQRGNAEVHYDLISEDHKTDPDTVILNAPESLDYAPGGRPDVYVSLRTLNEWEENTLYRPIHRKAIFLENENWCLYLIGSSNFTSPGLGIGKHKNYEANIVYVINGTKNKVGGKLINESYVDGDYIDKKKKIQWVPKEDEDKSTEDNMPTLHKAFKSALLNFKKDKFIIELNFEKDVMPKSFSIHDELLKKELYSSEKWMSGGKSSNVNIKYNGQRPPSGLYVKWDNLTVSIWWPINILNPSVLPPPEELKNLPLEVLLNVLSSSKPPHRVISQWLKRQKRKDDENDSGPLIDPHKRVNTSTFLLQRTRKISYSLTALKEKLEKPIYTIESLHWRVFGPIGVKALYKAILETAKSEEEKAFLLTETALELANLIPQINKETISLSEFRKTIKEIIMELKKEINNLNVISNQPLGDYINNVFQEMDK